MGETGRCTRRTCTCILFLSYYSIMSIQAGLGFSLFIFSLANHAANVPTVIAHPGIQSLSYNNQVNL